MVETERQYVVSPYRDNRRCEHITVKCDLQGAYAFVERTLHGVRLPGGFDIAADGADDKRNDGFYIMSG